VLTLALFFFLGHYENVINKTINSFHTGVNRQFLFQLSTFFIHLKLKTAKQKQNMIIYWCDIKFWWLILEVPVMSFINSSHFGG